MMDRNDPREGPFECVESDLGDQLGLLADPDLAPDLRKRLNDHLTICDACRLEQAMAKRVAGGLASGELTLDAPGNLKQLPRRRIWGKNPAWGRNLAWGGGLAVAASLSLMFLMPPTASGPDVLRRSGDDGPRFLRPVEGEVLSTSTPTLEWTRIEGATAYRLQISKVGDEAVWSARVKTTSVRVPESFPLSGPASYRAILEPIPADLAGLADVNVTFRRDGTPQFLAYRVKSSSLAARLIGAAGLGAFLLGIVSLYWRRKSRAE